MKKIELISDLQKNKIISNQTDKYLRGYKDGCNDAIEICIKYLTEM